MRSKTNNKIVVFKPNQTTPGIQFNGAISINGNQPPKKKIFTMLHIKIILAYSPKIWISPFIGAALGLYAIMIFYRMLRGFVNAAGSGVPVFYIFFYICTLEILPLAVGMKAFLS
jgi:hypothetical protein